jgi:uncharacterized membrane protein YhhN
MASPYLWLTILLVGVEILAVGKGWRRVQWIAKPAALLALIFWFTLVGMWQGPLVWFGAGVVASMIGDVLLMLPGGFFLSGLLVFMAAHVCYIIGFNTSAPLWSWQAVLMLIITLVVLGVLLEMFLVNLQRKPGNQAVIIPVTIYGVIISLMVVSAMMTPFRPGWSSLAAALAIVGAVLFFVSDITLALNRFIRPLAHSSLMVMVTYYLGQIAIAAGALLAFAMIAY